MRHTEGSSRAGAKGTSGGGDETEPGRESGRGRVSAGGRRETGPKETQGDLKGRCGHLFEEMAGDLLTRIPTEGVGGLVQEMPPGCITFKAPNTGQSSPGNAVYVSACSRRPTSARRKGL